MPPGTSPPARAATLLRSRRTPRTVTAPKGPAPEDPDYGSFRPLFRRSSGNARVTIFQGGHDIATGAALRWLARQQR